MHRDYTIREASLSDLDTLVAFALRESTETEGTEPDTERLQHGVRAGLDGSAPVSYWVAAAANGDLAGSISVVTEWSNFRGGHYWWIQSLFITPEHRGRGLVDMLLDFVARRAAASGALDLRLYVLNSNSRAISAYRRCGFDVAQYTIMVRDLE